MKRSLFWQNFTLGAELHIAGRFIYNGLRSFHEMDTLHNEDEVFEVLYNLSVGLERILKVAVVLIEHDDGIDQEQFEKSLITHNHLDLLNRVAVKHHLHLAGIHNAFLQMLSSFYKTHRYARFGQDIIDAGGNEKKVLHAFFEKHLKMVVSDALPFEVTENSPRMKKFLGKLVGKISVQLFESIQKEADRRQIYTTELRCDSKAEKIFLRRKFDFMDEDVLVKELLVFLVNSPRTTGHLGFIKGMQALEFDPELEAEYIQSLGSDEKKLEVLDELETLYGELDRPGERLEALGLIGNPHVYFDSEADFGDDPCEDTK